MPAGAGSKVTPSMLSNPSGPIVGGGPAKKAINVLAEAALNTATHCLHTCVVSAGVAKFIDDKNNFRLTYTSTLLTGPNELTFVVIVNGSNQKL